jgi:riboflavin kinase/FMN adenylyltransferase
VQSGAIAIGNFDGVHRGHASLIASLRDQARLAGGPAVALTFDPHPATILRPGVPLVFLTTLADRVNLLHSLGAEHVVILRVTKDLLQLTAREFFVQVVLEQLQARAVVEGPNFCFGRNREGTVEVLAELCRGSGLGLTIVPPVVLAEGEVSSSRVRASLLQGDVVAARQLLGRPYLLRGQVVTGQRRGQTIGFPTANLAQTPTVVPGEGVYAVRVRVEGVRESTWPGGANIGPNPTFGEQERKIEVHLIGFTGDLYGRQLGMEFVSRLRETRAFSGPAELIAQLQRDVEQARQQVELFEREQRTA